MTETNTEHSLAKEVTELLIKEKRRDRRWRNLRFFFTMALLIWLVISLMNTSSTHHNTVRGQPHVALVRLNGIIMEGTPFSAERTHLELERAFSDTSAAGVALIINSPGGSPVQATLIHDDILSLKKEYNKKVLVVGLDLLTSGAYLIASAADQIYTQKDTITGSIGVIMSSFGFTDAISKLGISRRVFTAGTNKNRLDPFSALTLADQKKIHTILEQTHHNFIQNVIAGRKDRLRGKHSALFSGDFWLGTQAQQLGLIDGTAPPWVAMKTVFGTSYFVDYTDAEPLFQSLSHDIMGKLGTSLNAPSHHRIALLSPFG